MRVFLIRHPRPAIAPGICYGASEIGLADDVGEYAAHVRSFLPADIALFSSPLRRCRQLAEALHGAPLFDERLREMNFGAWELQPWSEIPRHEIDAWAAAPLAYRPPGGESVSALYRRVEIFMAERLTAGSTDFAVVTHAGVMKVFSALLQGLAQETWFNMRFGYGEVTCIDTTLALSGVASAGLTRDTARRPGQECSSDGR